MIKRMDRIIVKALENNVSGTYMNFWRTNFNMPVPNLFDNLTGWVRYAGPFTYFDSGYSFDVSGFSPGFETVLGVAVFDWENDTGSSVTLNETMFVRWGARDGFTTLSWPSTSSGVHYSLSLPASSWTEYLIMGNIGLAPWEIDASGTFFLASSSTGSYPNTESRDNVAFSNVPSQTFLGSDKKGSIWVEGIDLCFVNDNQWKHTISGISLGYVGTSSAGALWVDTDSDLNWVGDNGYNYYLPWKIKQFASIFFNGPTSTVFAGTTKAGSIWVDNQFGSTHLSYIGYDGYKYLCGAGDYPY